MLVLWPDAGGVFGSIGRMSSLNGLSSAGGGTGGCIVSTGMPWQQPIWHGVLQLTPQELQIAELIREKALQLTRDEVPHAISVELDELGEKVVHATVFVETESQKQIVVGRGGSVIKQIGTRARPEIEHLLGRQIFLELQVKTRPKWRRDAAMLERLGI